jgi:hypothetical protein
MDWGNPMYVTGQAFMLLSYIAWIMSYQQKTRGGVLLWATIGPLMSTIAYICLGAWTAFVANMVAIPRNILMHFLDKNKTEDIKKRMLRSDWVILFVCLSLNVILGGQTLTNIWTVICLISTLLFTISVCQKNVGVYRILGVISSACVVIYAFGIDNVVAVCFESILIVGEAVGVVRYFYGKSKSRRTIGQIPAFSDAGANT